jgi:transposase
LHNIPYVNWRNADCGGALRPVRRDVTEIPDYMAGLFHVIRNVRPKLRRAISSASSRAARARIVMYRRSGTGTHG